MDFTGPARVLTPQDITIIAGFLGCHVATVQAVLAIESRGTGFEGRRPIILNEPHVFYRKLPSSKRGQAVREGLAYRRWGARPYLKTQAARYGWLDRAMKILETAALRSCSWGLGQIMGFNHKACGFDPVQAFVRAMTISEGAQLYAMARFIVSKKLQRHLRSRNWARFARGYNGAGYAKHGYHTKLARAYAARPRSEKYTPPPADDEALLAMRAEHPRFVRPTLVPKDTSLKAYQQRLKDLGFDPGPIDGVWGDRTKDAVADFQRAHGRLGVDGILGPLTSAAVDRAHEARPAKLAAAGLVTAGGLAVAGAPAGLDWTHLVALAVAGGVVAAAWCFRNTIKERIQAWTG